MAKNVVSLESVQTIREEKSVSRVIDKNFKAISHMLNETLEKRLSTLEAFANTNGQSLKDVIYRITEHAVQAHTTDDQSVDGKTILEFPENDRLDGDYFSRPSDTEIKVKTAGYHKITIKIISDESIRVVVLQNANEIKRSVIYS